MLLKKEDGILTTPNLVLFDHLRRFTLYFEHITLNGDSSNALLVLEDKGANDHFHLYFLFS